MGEFQSNFAFMSAEWPLLAQRARKAEQFAFIDPRASMMYVRHTAEHVVDWIYQNEPSIHRPYQTDFNRYKQKAQAYLRAHLDLVTLQRLRKNKPLTELNLAELERLLQESGTDTDEDLARARPEGLAKFVRSLVGLERTAVEEALSEFIINSTLTASQLDFLNVLATQLSENGAVPIGALYESPYRELAPTGPDELFGLVAFDRLEEVLQSFDEGLRVG